MAEGEFFDICGDIQGMVEPNGELSLYPEPTWEHGRLVRMSFTYPLHVACQNNASISVIQALIKAWPDAVKTYANTRLPLQEACSCGQSLPALQLLVEAWPESIQCPTSHSDRYLPLHLALMKSMVSIDIIQFLVQHWPESLQKETDFFEGSRSALLIALEGDQNDDIIQYLVQQCPESIKKCDESGATALHYACHPYGDCQNGTRLSIIQFLVQRWPGALQIKAERFPFGIPLMFALNYTKTTVEIITYLIDMWPESIKEQPMWPESIKETSHDVPTALFEALFLHYKNVEIISLLIDRWPDAVQIPNSSGMLPVYWALRERKVSLECVHLLTNGVPPLHFLCRYSRTPWIPTRMNEIKHVASICPDDDKMQFYQGMLPFHWACRSRAPRSVLEWWCEQYPAIASVRTTHTHELPLHCYLSSIVTESEETAWKSFWDYQFYCGNDAYLSAVQFLVEKHPDALNCTNRMGWLPVHVAALRGASLDVLYYLVCQNPVALLTGSQCLSSSKLPLDKATG